MTKQKAKLVTLPLSLLAGLLLLLASRLTHAGLNLRDAAYTGEWTDLELKQNDLRFTRTYSSRSRFNGILGFGWCTDFEVSVERLDADRLLLRDCSSGDSVFKATRTGTYLSPGRPGEWIGSQGGQLARGLSSGERQIFASSGKLRTWHRPGFLPIEIGYGPAGLPKEIRSGKTWLSLFYEARSRKLSRLKGSDGRSVTYHRAAEDLIRVRGPSRETHEYGYDELHNLTRAKFPDGSHETNVYDKDLDRLLSTTDRDACETTITYTVLKSKAESGQRSETDTRCPGSPPESRKTEFWWATDAAGLSRLARSRSETSGAVSETWFDGENGRPVRIVTPKGQTFHLFYDTDGRLTSVFEAGRETLRLIYKSGSRKPAEVLRPGSGSLFLEYDTRGRLRAVTGSKDGARGSAVVAEIASTLKDLFGGQI